MLWVSISLQRISSRPITLRNFVQKMELNDNKAGMEGLDKERINLVIQKATEGTNYHKHQLKREKQLAERVHALQERVAQLTPEQVDAAEKEMDEEAVVLESASRFDRTIVHVDMDAFYAAVEMRDDPTLRGKPIAVGSASMISTSNYAARRFGVRAAMPGFIAMKLCPQLIIVPTHFDKYTKISEQIREVMLEYDPNMQTMSLDEAYLDLTHYLSNRTHSTHEVRRRVYCGDCKCWLPYEHCEANSSNQLEELNDCTRCAKKVVIFKDTVSFGNTAQEVTRELRFKIQQKTGLTASAGISCNSMLAKVCSDKQKPDGQFYLPPDIFEVKQFIKDLPVRKVSGVGSVSEALLKSLGIINCSDLYKKRGIIKLLFSKLSAESFLEISLGLGSTEISSNNDRDRKSVSVERTFSQVSDPIKLQDICQNLCQNLFRDVEELKLTGRTVTLKLKTVQFEVRTRAKSISCGITKYDQLLALATEILCKEIAVEKPKSLNLRLMGVRLSNFIDPKDIPSRKSSLDKFLVPTPSSSSCDVSDEDSRQSLSLDDVALPSVVGSTHYDCPVCGQAVHACNEHDMGVHVEECLSKKAVDQIIKEETPPQRTIPSQPLTNSNSAKNKRKSPKDVDKDSKIKKIDSYFQKKN